MTLRFEVQDSLGFITLDRPDKLNALTSEMGMELARLVDSINERADIRAVLLRGEGRVFSAGGDLAFLQANLHDTRESNAAKMRDFYENFLSLRRLKVPSIALMQGRATGAGLTLALGCDLRVASEETRVSTNFVRLGLNPGMGGTFLLERLIGPGRAAEMLYTGRDVAMGEALAIGLVNHVVQLERLESAGRELAQQIAANAPLAVRLTKGIVARGAGTLSEALALEAQAQAECFASWDLQEGLQSILERRSPQFEGR